MKGMKKVISILVRIISITRMKLLMLPKAKKPDHFACKMGLHTSLIYIKKLSLKMEKYLQAHQVLLSDDAMKSPVLEVKLAGFWEVLGLNNIP